ncbi:UNVERIFIED_CONTAM: hypothetical protein GTU68_033240 [Idotea baltica]|nr:hypothetical protein [Idotea baltica]
MHEFLNQLHNDVWSHYDCFTVGEGVGIPLAEAPLYVDPARKELHTIYHFDHFNLDTGPGGKFDIQPVNYQKFKAIFYDWDKLTENNCWNIIYLGNHDLGRMLTRFGNHEYRETSAKLLNTILLTLRGTPIIYMGDELGMTNSHYSNIDQIDDIETKNNYRELVTNGSQSHEDFMRSANVSSRDHARTPMPWSADHQGGFTNKEPWIPLNPNYSEINAAAQVNDPNSVYQYCAQLIKLRRTTPALIYGDLQRSSLDDDRIFAYTRSLNDVEILTILNLSSASQLISIKNFSEENVLINNYQNIVMNDGNIILQPWQAILISE